MAKMIDKEFIELCRTKLFEYILDNPGETFDAFFLGPEWQRKARDKTREDLYKDEPDLPTVEEFEKPVRVLENWECYDDDYEYMEEDKCISFECAEYDGQLRGYVSFDEDGEITEIEVCGE